MAAGIARAVVRVAAAVAVPTASGCVWLDWFGDGLQEPLGTQQIDDGVYRQGFIFSDEGSYLISAHFEYGGEPYDIDFPMTVGRASSAGTVGAAMGLLAAIILGANFWQRRKLQRAKMLSAARRVA